MDGLFRQLSIKTLTALSFSNFEAIRSQVRNKIIEVLEPGFYPVKYLSPINSYLLSSRCGGNGGGDGGGGGGGGGGVLPGLIGLPLSRITCVSSGNKFFSHYFICFGFAFFV